MPNAANLIKKVKALFDKKEYQAIIDLLTDAVLEAENNADLYAWRGRTNFILNKYNEALADAEKALSIDPKSSFAYRIRGIAWYGLKEYEKAIADYDKAIELDPNDAKAYKNRGVAWVGLRQYKKALADFDKAIELDPNDAMAYNNRGLAWVGLQEYKKAMADFDKAIELGYEVAQYLIDLTIEELEGQKGFKPDDPIIGLANKLGQSVSKIIKFATPDEVKETVHYSKLFVG